MEKLKKIVFRVLAVTTLAFSTSVYDSDSTTHDGVGGFVIQRDLPYEH
ncbi:hypothetical protein M3182_14870 [Mesobacillus maritimus]|nr:hypothetical protein [Mesobacillus maritimus]MCM3587018.1 hypothetical protein [Mesobacillus maritimus]MCM3670943.1 hypothetical protein [Mesobacillus maritimus]